jgi:hypothetical protein
LNQEKQDNPVFQTEVSDFSCDDYISNLDVPVSKTSVRKEVRASEVRIVVERDPTWS